MQRNLILDTLVALFRIIKIISNIPASGLPHREPVAQVCEPIAIDILPFVVLVPWFLNHIEPVHATTRVDGGNGSVDSPVLEPRPAVGAPGGADHKCVYMPLEVIHGVLGHSNGFDSVYLTLVEHSDDVFRAVLENGKDRALGYRCPGAEEHCQC